MQKVLVQAAGELSRPDLKLRGKMFFLVIRHDHPEAERLRADLKQPHRAFLASLGKKLLSGGAIFNDRGDVIGGSITFGSLAESVGSISRIPSPS